MPKWLFVLFLPMVGSAGASAQTSSCQWVGNVWTCNQQQATPYPQSGGVDWSLIRPQPQPNIMNALRQGQEMRAAREAQQLDAEAQQRSTEIQGLHADVGQKLARGDCEGAAQLALSSGDIELAAQARDYCRK